MRPTKVYRMNAQAWVDGYRVIANKGGTRSGKTYSLMSFFVTLCISNKRKRVFDVVSESLPHLKRGALKDIENILTDERLIEGRSFWNKEER